MYHQNSFHIYTVFKVVCISLYFIMCSIIINCVRYIPGNIILNTFASQCLVFEKKNELFFLERSSNLTREFLYDNINKIILLNFLVIIVIQKIVSNLMHFQGEMIYFFLKNKALRSESVNHFMTVEQNYAFKTSLINKISGQDVLLNFYM